MPTPLFKKVIHDCNQQIAHTRHSSLAHFLAVRTKLWICILFFTGLRINELINFDLQKAALLMQNGTCSIFDLKTQHFRDIFISKKNLSIFRGELLWFFQKYPSSHLVSNFHGKPLKHNSTIIFLNKFLLPYSTANSLFLKSHSFRIGFATRLFASEVSPTVIQSLLGHSLVSTTYKYNRHIPSPLQKTKALAKVF